MKIEKRQTEKKTGLKLPTGAKKVLLLALMAIFVKKGISADPVWATIVDIILEDNLHSYFVINEHNSEEKSFTVRPGRSVATLYRRYLKEGGKILYEDEGRNDFHINGNNLIRIEMPDGRLVRIVDIFNENSGFKYAYEYEARQNGN